LSALGRPADALPVTKEAVAMYRELAAASPDRYRPDLAQSLTNLGAMFSELGRQAERHRTTADDRPSSRARHREVRCVASLCR
jgi:hypothetical protein